MVDQIPDKRTVAIPGAMGDVTPDALAARDTAGAYLASARDGMRRLQEMLSSATASPGVVKTVADLTAKYPTGTPGLFVVLADGYTYYWSGSEWTRGTVYQSQGIADQSIDYPQLSALARGLILSPRTIPDVALSFGLFTESFDVVESTSWRFALTPVRSGEAARIATRTDGTHPTVLLFDRSMDLVDARYDYACSYTASCDGYLAVNMYVGALTATPQDATKLELSGSFSGMVHRRELIASDETTDGYTHASIGPDGTVATNGEMWLTPAIDVTPGSWIVMSMANARAYRIYGIYASGDGGQTVSSINQVNPLSIRDSLIRIPSGVSRIRVAFFVGSMLRIWRGVIHAGAIDGTRTATFPGGSPLDYTYHRAWARRDFYNDRDSSCEYVFDATRQPGIVSAKSSVLDVSGDAGFMVSQSDQGISFSQPVSAGMTGIQVHSYSSITTERLYIGSLGSDASIGIAYGDGDLSDGLIVLVSNSVCTARLRVAGSDVRTASYPITDVAGNVLQVQNTGCALIISLWDPSLTRFTRVGRFDFGAKFDARQAVLLTTWTTHIVAQATGTTDGATASFTRFDSAIRSGSNSVSIRFLRYEDGTVIQRGRWLYYLVEGTGETISDLFTQIVRIDPSTGEVQSIGAILEIRGDGVDADLLLGDDSITMCYDRRDGLWKGISCGMEYADYLSNTNDRPKLYLQTRTDLLAGGIVIIQGATQITDTTGRNVGTSQTKYSEDYDFYWDASASVWVVTGNKVSGGYMVYNTPNLADHYSTIQDVSTVPDGVRDTGNQYVNFQGHRYITTGGTSNTLGVRDATGDYLGPLDVQAPLSASTTGPWCTLVPYIRGIDGSTIHRDLYLLSFDRVNLTGGAYDHGGLYCWKAIHK